MKLQTYPATSMADWLAWRKQDVTASDIGALFGVHPFRTKLELWADKSGHEMTRGDNSAMRKGRIFEPAIAAAAADEYGWSLEKSNDYIRAVDLRIGCTPDYIRTGEGGGPVECKFVQPQAFAKQWAGGAPLAYVLQCLVQVYLTGAPHGWVVAMVDNHKKDLFCYDVPRNDDAWGRIVASVAEFWQLVESKTMPSPVFASDLDVLRRVMPPDPQGDPIDLTGDNLLPTILEEREMLKARADEVSARLEAIDAEIVHKMAGSPEARTNGWRITNKKQTRKEYTVKASSYSVMRITKLKGEENV